MAVFIGFLAILLTHFRNGAGIQSCLTWIGRIIFYDFLPIDQDMTSAKLPYHSGTRPGAERSQGSTAYGTSSETLCRPKEWLPVVSFFPGRKKRLTLDAFKTRCFYQASPVAKKLDIPLYVGKVSAGFPSPADDYIEKTLDLNELLIQKPAATFFVRAQGESMLGAGIHPNDILVVDRSLEPAPGKIVICALDGELVVKRLKRRNDNWLLASENPAYPDIALSEEVDTVIWGVVTNVIHAL